MDLKPVSIIIPNFNGASILATNLPSVLAAARVYGGDVDIIVVEKMIEGRLRKFYEESVLRSQTFVIDGETKIEKVLENAAKEFGAPVEIAGYVRFAVGEGIDKPTEDFAAEVNSVAGN